MCGICGIVGTSEHEVVERMTLSLAHRGPDDSGVALFPLHKLALGHRRLSVMDLSPKGRQPMSNEDGTVWLSFNGEVYNFRELKAALDPARHQFVSETDSEVILHLYEERGPAAFKALNGMFALALYDAERSRLFLVRDQLGVKPLYYTETDGKLLFGSEIKALLAANSFTPEVDWQSARDYFSFLFVPAPNTIWRGIFQLPPAHWLEYDLRGCRVVRIERYWQPAVSSTPAHQPDISELRAELRGLLSEAVTQQMVSDVPLGAFLSGGVDSNIIVGLMASQAQRPVKTFTVLFEGAELDYYDERVEARRIADKFGTEHHELSVDLSHPEEMLELVEYFDQPFGNTTFYLTYLLSRYTREHVTVALSGAGGDELFAGYPRYRAVQAARWLRFLPRGVAQTALAALTHLPDHFADRRLHRIRALLGGLDDDEATQYLQWVYYLSEERKDQLLKSHPGGMRPAARILTEHLREMPRELEDGNRFSLLDVQTFLPDNLLEYSDKMSMAWALELRVPYLDPRVVEFAFRLPFATKLNRRGSKVILREAFADLIPAEHQRAPKKGFNVPLGNWMRTKLDRYFDELLPRSYVEREGVFNYDCIQLLRAEHQRGRRDNGYELFAILMFDAWYRRYVTGTLSRKLNPTGDRVRVARVAG
ncbi:MAG: asparagine synthase (glutamine-hydrolyzing) [Acidobacteria bacterium]|nr:asparagine synthase (glutamine-hydrolyzing) [Acidobacteriota bacterium]MBI3428048.1 asparagine synthase (glutamine-hydrolyzing) [Acidobacteriota bacterium]